MLFGKFLSIRVLPPQIPLCGQKEHGTDQGRALFVFLTAHGYSLQASIYLLCGFSGIDDAQDLAVGHELRGQIVPSKFSYVLKRHPTKYLLLSDVRRAQLSDGAAGKKFPEDRLQRRLRGCAQNG